MQNENIIQSGSFVEFHYDLTDNDGVLLDSSRNRSPLPYVHGGQSLIPGLEKKMEGLEAGVSLRVRIPAKEAYGEIEPRMIRKMDKSEFPGAEDMHVGAKLQAKNETGEEIVVTVTEVGTDYFILDGNHPLAGKDLNFEIDILSVKKANLEEMGIKSSSASCGEGCTHH